MLLLSFDFLTFFAYHMLRNAGLEYATFCFAVEFLVLYIKNCDKIGIHIPYY